MRIACPRFAAGRAAPDPRNETSRTSQQSVVQGFSVARDVPVGRWPAMGWRVGDRPSLPLQPDPAREAVPFEAA